MQHMSQIVINLTTISGVSETGFDYSGCLPSPVGLLNLWMLCSPLSRAPTMRVQQFLGIG